MSCTPAGAPGYAAGAVTFVALNTDPALAFNITFQELPAPQPRVDFVLTPGTPGLVTSRDIRLNGQLLQMTGETMLPDMPGVPASSPFLTLPPYSYAFSVYSAANAPACM